MLRLSGTKLNFTTAYHPQSDGQTEVRNRGLEQYLRAFTADKPNKWVNFLPWAELALNCFYHEGLGTSPFKALYGRDPPPLIAAPPSASTPADVASLIRQRGELIVELRHNLEKAQQRMKASADKHRRDLEFKVGDKVLLKLQQYRQYSVARPLSTKLARRFYGPFEIIESIVPVVYRLHLPPGSRVHNVFHVNLLKPFVDGSKVQQMELPPVFARGRPVSRPIKLLEKRTTLHEGTVVDEGLLQWDDDGGENPSWEPISVINRRFPALLLEDKELAIPGGVDTGVIPVQIEDASIEEGEAIARDEQVDEPDYSTRGRKERQTETSAIKSRPRRRTRPPERLGDFVSR